MLADAAAAVVGAFLPGPQVSIYIYVYEYTYM